MKMPNILFVFNRKTSVQMNGQVQIGCKTRKNNANSCLLAVFMYEYVKINSPLFYQASH